MSKQYDVKRAMTPEANYVLIRKSNGNRELSIFFNLLKERDSSIEFYASPDYHLQLTGRLLKDNVPDYVLEKLDRINDDSDVDIEWED